MKLFRLGLLFLLLGNATHTLALTNNGISLSAPSTVNDGVYTVSVVWNGLGQSPRYVLSEQLDGTGWQAVDNDVSTKSYSSKASGSYEYRVTEVVPIFAGGMSIPITVSESTTTVVNVIPAVPTIDQGTGGSNPGDYTLDWADSADLGLTHWEVEETLEGGTATTQIYTDSIAVFTDKPSGTHSYRIRACHDTLCSAYSASSYAVYVPNEVGGLTGPGESNGTFGLSWDADSGVVTYKVWRLLSNGTWDFIGDSSTVNYNGFNSIASGEYTYRVQACTSEGICGGYSEFELVEVRNEEVSLDPLTSGPAAFVQPTHDETVGALAFSTEVGVDGSATASIPISVPPGLGGLEPSLSLNYNSNGQNGVVGEGWNLSGVSLIHRCPTSLARGETLDPVDFDGNDKLCLDGQRLVVTNGQYGANGTRYRTEQDTISRITSHGNVAGMPSYLTVETKDGKTLTYGNTADSRIEAHGRSDNAVYTWALNRIEDPFGNYSTTEYYENTNTTGLRAKEIAYSANTSGVSPQYLVTFEYETRPDVVWSYVGGTKVQDFYRLKAIKTHTDARELHEYNLTYEESSPVVISRLKTVERCVVNGACIEARITNTWNGGGDGAHDDVLDYNLGAGSTIDYEKIVVDLNADGVSDLMLGHSSAEHGWLVYTALGTFGGGFEDGQTQVIAGGANQEYVQHVGDFNGDGFPDVARVRAVPGYWQIFLALGNGDGTFESNPLPTVLTLPQYGDWQSHVSDFDGDGRADFAVMHSSEDHGWVVHTALSNDSGFYHLDESQVVASASDYNASRDWKQQIADFNGDGLADITLYITRANPYFGVANSDAVIVSLSDGSGGFTGFYYDGNLFGGLPGGPVLGKTQFADFNGDSIADLGFFENNGVTWNFYVAISDGAGGWAGVQSSSLDFSFDTYAGNRETYIGDYNGDGRLDVALIKALSSGTTGNNQWDVAISLNNGDGTFALTHVNENLLPGPLPTDDNLPWYIGDFDGDGISDLLFNELSSADWAVEVAFGSSEAYTLEIINNGFGLSTRFEYLPLTDTSVYTKGTAATYPALDIQYPLSVVRSRETSDGIGGMLTSNYHYTGLVQHLAGRGSLGFAEYEVDNVDTGRRTVTTFSQSYPDRTERSPETILTYSSTNQLLSRTVNNWETVNLGSGITERYLRQLESTTVEKWDLNGAFMSEEVNAYTYTGNNDINTINKDVYDAMGATVQSSFVDNDYINSTTPWIKGMLTDMETTTTAWSDTVTRFSKWNFDTSTGKITSEELKLGDGTTFQTTHYEDVDQFGHHRKTRIAGSNVLERESTAVYDATGRFVTSAENALDHPVTNTYVPDTEVNAGQLSTTTDANGIVSEYFYDAFGRVTQVTTSHATATSADPVSSYTSMQHCADVLFGFCGNATYVVTKSTQGGSGGFVAIDAHGREVLTASQIMDGNYAYVASQYDAVGNNTHISEPYQNGDTIFWNEIQYDELDRKVRAIYPSGREDTITYDGLTVTSSNDVFGKNQSKTEVRNALNQLLSVEDNDQNVISYTYNAQGNMLEVAPPGGSSNTTTIGYDQLGRKTSMDDPDKGLWTYSYNVLGQLVTQTNAKGETSCTAYDLLGRKIARVDNYQGGWSNASITASSDATNQCDNGGASATVTLWGFDNAAGNAVGKLAAVVTTDGSYGESLTYDSYGRLIQHAQTVAGESHTVDSSYDSLHRVDEITYPGVAHRLTIKTAYNNLGFPVELMDAITGKRYYQALAMDARGNITSDKTGNGVNVTRGFEAKTGYIDFIAGYSILDAPYAPSIQYLDYDFDDLGNLVERNDYKENIAESFQYDLLNRLTSTTADFGNGQEQYTAVTYDALGNIKTKTGVGSYNYGDECAGGGFGPHAVCGISSPKNTAYTYDLNGNMTGGDGRSITYSSFDKPTSIIKGSNTTLMAYGAARQLIQREDSTASGTTTTTFVSGIYEHVELPNSSVKERHYIGDFAILTITGRNSSNAGSREANYLHKDHLGSITTITDTYGLVVERFSFDPWGKRRAPNIDVMELLMGPWESMLTYEQGNLTLKPWVLSSSITNRGFTGHEQLDGVELIHMGGRVYDAEIGRFLSADPFIQDRTNLQALNRYSYVLNNPLSYTDPSGYFFKKIKKAFKKFLKGIKNAWKGLWRGIKGALVKIGEVINRVPYLSTVAGIALAVYCGPCATTYFQVMAGLNTAIAVANGGDIMSIAAGFAVSMVTAGVGDAFAGALQGAIGEVAAQYTASAIIGGVAAKAMGGDFEDGFVGGLASAATRHAMGEFGGEPADATDGREGYDSTICDDSGGNCRTATNSEQDLMMSVNSGVADSGMVKHVLPNGETVMVHRSQISDLVMYGEERAAAMNCSFTNACVEAMYNKIESQYPGLLRPRTKAGKIRLGHPVKVILEEGLMQVGSDLSIKDMCQARNTAACGGDYEKAWIPN
jgi:RHS repeat-associated protein